MYIVGYIAVILAAIIVVLVLALGVLSLSDVRRYLRIRNV
jgi:energy-converting hydrogenase Eha subunit A